MLQAKRGEQKNWKSDFMTSNQELKFMVSHNVIPSKKYLISNNMLSSNDNFKG